MSLKWTQSALDDLDRIAMFNERISEQHASNVNWRIISKALTLPDWPLRGRPAGDFRELSLIDIQYVLTYLVTESDVTIVGVHSTRERGRL